jgi:hypothetical protein
MPFPLTDAQLNRLLDEFPAVAGRPRQLQDLSGGLTNRNVKVIIPDAVYVARCVDTGRNFLGIDRDEEYYNTKMAEQAGVGSPVIDYRPDLGIFLLGYLNGKTLCNDDFQRPGVVAKVAAGCQALRRAALPGRFACSNASPGTTGPSGTTASRFRSITSTTRMHLPRSKGADGHRPDHCPVQQRPAGGNFIEDGERVWIIDYEYSGNNDPCFELGNIWSSAACRPTSWTSSSPRTTAADLRQKIARAHLQASSPSTGGRCGAVSKCLRRIGFDFWGWAMERYEAAVAEFKAPHFTRLLDDVSATD